MVQILSEQAAAIREKIADLIESLSEIEALKTEVIEMQSVDFKKYADIIINLEMKNDFYFLIKYFDSETLDRIRSRFDKESSIIFLTKFCISRTKQFGFRMRVYRQEVQQDYNLQKAIGT